MYGVAGNSLSRAVARDDREVVEALGEAGLLTRRQHIEPDTQTKLDIELPRQDLFRTDRIVFSLRDLRGTLVGFAGRALRKRDEPKYLYTIGLRKSQLLYRADRVFEKAKGSSIEDGQLHVFLVEGLVDALRLESLNFPAVAILGSSLATGQIEVLSRIAERLDQNDAALVVHVFLDTDDAGRRAAVRLLPDLLRAAAQRPGFNVDVIQPPRPAWVRTTQGGRNTVNDPDTLLQHVRDRDEASAILKSWSRSPMSTLLADRLECSVDELEPCWERASPGTRSRALRLVEKSVPQKSWADILARTSPFSRWLGEESADENWVVSLRRFLEAGPRDDTLGPVARLPLADEVSEKNKLVRAIEVAQASTQRREFPIDHGSWDRLRLAADAFYHPLKQRLGHGLKPCEPMLAVYVPKADGRQRLKAIPCAEDLVMQQYVLSEILREHPESKSFAELVPAVRFWPGSHGGGKIAVTGPDDMRPVRDEVVSFAYQVRMDVLNGPQPPGREGMFRRYYECWTGFLDYVLRRSRRFRATALHIARLDIRGFYDNLSQDTVVNALTPGLAKALEYGNAAPLFLPKEAQTDSAAKRAGRIVDWLADQSFNYKYLDPADAKTAHPPRADRGVPQGPDLSAYLANVALFAFDRRLTEEIARLDEEARVSAGVSWVVGGIYARYVDDIVVVTTTGADLARLRVIIETELAKLGLELNGKAEPEAPKTPTQFRRWLTSHRGAGFGASGLFGEAPPMLGLPRLDFLADAGDVDRADALSILHSSEVDRVVVPRKEIQQRIESALKADELRYGEYVAAARGLWTCVVDKHTPAVGDSDPIEAETVRRASTEFYREWAKVPALGILKVPPSDAATEQKDLHQSLPLVIALEGLERLLGRRADRSPALPASEQRDFERWRIAAARLVNAGLARELVDYHVREKCGGKLRLKHMVELRVGSVRWAASQVKPEMVFQDSEDDQWASNFDALRRSWISLAVGLRNGALLKRARLQLPDTSSLVRLHEAVARLTIGEGANASQDPLDEVAPRKIANHTDAADAILQLWLPREPGVVSRPEDGVQRLSRDALTALVNVAPRRAVHLLPRRPHLVASVFDGSPPVRLALVPVPPGIEASGLVGFDGAGSVVRIFFNTCGARSKQESFEPEELQWEPLATISAANAQSARIPAGLERPRFVLDIETPTPVRWLGWAFRGLAQVVREINRKHQTPGSEGSYCCVPTALNLLGKSPPGISDSNDWRVVGFLVERKNLGNQGFRRLAEQGFLAVAVPEDRADLWRVGIALADLLGVPAPTHDSEHARFSGPALRVEDDPEWMNKDMLRLGAARLRGAGWFGGPRPDPSDMELPRSIDQLLRRLEAFPSTGTLPEDRYRRLTHLLACIAWPRAQRVRHSVGIDPSVPGAATALLARVAAAHFRIDEALAAELPVADEPPAWAPRRRPARAWYLVGQRLAKLSGYDDLSLHPSELRALVAGCFMLAFEIEARASVVEQLSLLPPLDRSLLDAVSDHAIDLADWGLDGGCCLVDEQDEHPETDERSSGAVHVLVGRLIDSSGANGQVSALSNVTALGWAVTMGVVTGLLKSEGLPLRGLPELQSAAAARIDLGDRLKRLAERLAQPGERMDAGEREGPFDDLSAVLAVWSDGRSLEDSFQTLRQIDEAAGIRVEDHESDDIVLQKDPEAEELEFRTADRGCYRLRIAQVFHGGLAVDKRDYESRREGDKLWYRWSESWCGDRLVGVGLVHIGLSSLAGFQAVPVRQAGPELSLPPVGASRPGPSRQDLAPSSESAEAAVPEAPRASLPQRERARPSAEGPEEKRLGDYKEISWRQRGTLKSPAHVRIALLQWDAGESYRHPLFECCFHNEANNPNVAPRTEQLHRNPWNWKASEECPSVTEHRRQLILHRVLEACDQFAVEVLVIPEYTMRAETVLWLEQQLPSLAPNLSVWAGTYRHAPGATRLPKSNVQDWDAALNFVAAPRRLAASGVRRPTRIERFKRYPAMADREIFRPAQSFVLRLGDYPFPREPEAHIIALICSEIFLAASPANLPGLAQSLVELCARFPGIAVGRLREWAEEQVKMDMVAFAFEASLLNKQRMPATILLVPSMTSRAQDFAVLGQASFFAAGITTVFCNAVHGKYGVGRSCFIGCDSWDLPENRDGGDRGMPTSDPYHGVAPGIFRQNSNPRGWLEKGEQALVIADIDPRNALAGSPRPQALPPALQLVAYLPILESWKRIRPRGGRKIDPCCPYASRTASRIWAGLVKAIESGEAGHRRTTADDASPGDLGAALKRLENLVPETTVERPNRFWLWKRREAYEREHKANPQPWPPPVALDWIWVDLGDPTVIDKVPRLLVPPYSDLPGDSRGGPVPETG